MEIIWKTIQLSCLFFFFCRVFVQDKDFFSERLWGESGWNYVEWRQFRKLLISPMNRAEVVLRLLLVIL